jgi:hypothetical protein
MTKKINLLSAPALSIIGLFASGYGAEVMKLVDFEGSKLPVNKAGEEYPNQYTGEGGEAKVGLTTDNVLFGKSAAFSVVQGNLYAEFNAHNSDGSRGFARDYAANPSAWKFNTYNRMSFWIKSPKNAAPLADDGTSSVQFGTYLKTVKDADMYSDEAGGGHRYHFLNLPNTNTWTYVVINTHPTHSRGESGQLEEGNQLHPTDEPGYNYFDCLTRFYINSDNAPGTSSAPVNYALDNFQFFQETSPENDDQVYSIAATYVPEQNKFIMSWFRPKDENTVNHEVRYSNKNIHDIGWNAATPAPNGIIEPPGWQGYNGMLYTTTAVKMTGTVYIAIKPQNSDVFSQISFTLPDAVTPIRFDSPAVRKISLDGSNTLTEWAAKEPSATLTVRDGMGRSLYAGGITGYPDRSQGALRIYRIEDGGRLLWTGPLGSNRTAH